MKSLSLIFSGSIRSLLLSMFEDENRPLYKLCRKIKLDRIEASSYEKHIQKIAIHTWGKKLEKEVFDEIMELTNRHSYYVNYLADTIWERCKKLPLGQRRLLKYIANNVVKNIQSQDILYFINGCKLTCNSIPCPD